MRTFVAKMAMDPTYYRLLEIQAQQQLCQLYSSDFDNVTGWELNPLIYLLQTIKEEYSFTKPEVYRTIIAVLHDYKSICGEKHRQKTLRYLKLLLSCNPELADYMSKVLPPALTVSARYSHCLQSALTRCDQQHAVNHDENRYCHHIEYVSTDNIGVLALRRGKSVETSPETVNTAVAGVSGSSTASTITCATMPDPSNLPITESMAPSSHTVLWPIAAHAPVQPMSQKAVTTATGLAKTQLEPNAEEHMMAQTLTRIQQGTATTQSPAFKLGTYDDVGKRSFVAVSKSGSISLAGTSKCSNAPLHCIITQASGKTVPMPRCFILRPNCTVASTSLRQGTMTTHRPNYQTVVQTGLNTDKSTADKKQHILVPAVHPNIRHLVIPRPRVIPQATFKISAATTGCQVIRAKTVAVPRLLSSTASISSLQGLPVITSPVSSQLAVAAVTGKDSPLSCIQTLVANAGSATQLLAINSKIADYNESAASQTDSSENDTVCQLTTVSADNRDSLGIVSTATDHSVFKQVKGGFDRKRLSATDDLENKVAKQS